MEKVSLSIVVPAYNEETGLTRLLPVLDRLRLENDWEVLIVDDGSTDRTAEIVGAYPDIRLIRQANAGNGAALKHGFREATRPYVLTMDADGQHKPEDIPNLVSALQDNELVTGVRMKDSDRPLSRRPGKWALTTFAEVVTGKPIHDINCGFRIYHRETLLRYMPFFPDGFSQPTAAMIAYLKNGRKIAYVPILVLARQGRKSNVKMVRDGLKALRLILLVTWRFDPRRVLRLAASASALLGLGISTVEIGLFKNFPFWGSVGLMIGGALYLVSFAAPSEGMRPEAGAGLKG